MGLRFRKSVKIAPGVKLNFSKSGVSTTFGGKGFSTTVSKRGTYRNIGIPGTGISYRKKIAGRSSKSHASHKTARTRVSSSSRAGSAQPKLPAAVQEWIALTGESNPSASISLSDTGEVTIEDSHGRVITDPQLISVIKRTPQYKQQMAVLVENQRKEVAGKVDDLNSETQSIVGIGGNSADVFSPEQFAGALEELEPDWYEPAEFEEDEPDQDSVVMALSEEADKNVKGLPWKVKKLRQQYVEDNFASRFASKHDGWAARKESFDKAEREKAANLNAQFQDEYEQTKFALERAISGDSDYIEEQSSNWLAECQQWIAHSELDIDFDIAFEYHDDVQALMVDLDLPEIENLPTQVATQLANGNLKMKDKTQKTLRAEYAQCVFGLAEFVSSNLFNVSPVIETVVISGYTQRRNKSGDLVDDYIYSIRFTRDDFYGVNWDRNNPEVFCMSFENRCNMTTTKVFKAIEPYEE